MAIKHQDSETKASMEYIYRYGNDLYSSDVRRDFILSDDDSDNRRSKIIAGNFIEFMFHTNIADPDFMKVLINMSKSYLKRMTEEEVDETPPDDRPKPKTVEEKEKALQEHLASEDNYKKFIEEFNKSEDLRRQVFEIFVRKMLTE